MSQHALEPVHRFELPFDFNFDAVVLVVAHPAGQAFQGRSFPDVEAKADPLDPASHVIAPRGEQNRTIILGSLEPS